MPPASCDCHAHICGPAAGYAYAADRVYTPPDALLPDYLGMLHVLGVERAVLVQPSIYGTDNQVLLAALAEAGSRCRGVAVVDGDIADDQLDRLHEAGIRGLRFNLVDVADPTGELPLADIAALCRRTAGLGWHAEFLIHVDDYPELDELFADFPVDVVLGHAGYMRPGRDTATPGFRALLRRLQTGRLWVKLSGPYRISAAALPYGDVLDQIHRLVEAAPGRMLWGTDWPHVMVKKDMPNDGDLCDLLAAWIPNADIRKQILVDNSAALYGFQ